MRLFLPSIPIEVEIENIVVCGNNILITLFCKSLSFLRVVYVHSYTSHYKAIKMHKYLQRIVLSKAWEQVGAFDGTRPLTPRARSGAAPYLIMRSKSPVNSLQRCKQSAVFYKRGADGTHYFVHFSKDRYVRIITFRFLGWN